MHTSSGKSLSLAVGLSLALLAGITGCTEPELTNAAERSGETEPIEVAVAPARWVVVPRTIPVTGSLYGDEQATLAAKVPGRVLEVLVDVGDRVAAGEELARIDPTDYRLAVEQRALA